MKKVYFGIKEKRILGNLYNPIMKLIVTLPCEAAICGGFVRDVMRGKPFKDIDIVVGHGEMAFVQSKAAILHTFPNATFELHPKDGNYEDDRIDEVYTVVGLPVPMDLILLKETVYSKNDLIHDFDLNINQCYLQHNKYGVFAYYDDSKYVQLINDVLPNPERIGRLMAKYPMLIWDDVARYFGKKEIENLKVANKAVLEDDGQKGWF